MTNMNITAVSGSPLDAPVIITAPFRCSHAGVLYLPGQTANVPGLVARYWVDCGYATAASAPRTRKGRSDDRTSE